MKLKHGLGIVLVLAAVAIALWKWPRKTTAPSSDASSETEPSSTASASDIPEAPALEWIDGGRPSTEQIAVARRRADAVRARLAAQPHAAPNFPSMPAAIGSGSQKGLPLGDYLDDVVHREFMPMGATCYADLVRKQPDAGGSVVLDVAIAGDSAVGGVVDSVDVDAGASLAQNDFITCVRESMMAMTFKAPPNGRVTFTLPLEFSP
jgi:hypothetical protein